jgi:hypothetical protein
VAAGTVERFTDADCLFKVRLDILGAPLAAGQGGAVFPHPRPEHARGVMASRQSRCRLSRPTRELPRPPGERVNTAEAGVEEPNEGFFVRTRADLRRIEAPPPRAVIWSTP